MPSCHLSCRSIKATRKRHHCDWCGQTIEKGKPAEYSFGLFENEPSGGYMHPECDLAYSHESQTTEDFDFDWHVGKFERGGFKEENQCCCQTTDPFVDDALAVLQRLYTESTKDLKLSLYAFTKAYGLIESLYTKHIPSKDNHCPLFLTANFNGDLLLHWLGRNDWNYIQTYIFADPCQQDFIYVRSKSCEHTNYIVKPRTLSKYHRWLFNKC